MSCYHPLVAFPSGSIGDNGKEKYVIKKAYLLSHSLDEVYSSNGILIPCGHCLGCRLDYARKWADRMMLELETSKKAVFLTLTYDNEHCHWTEYDDFGLGVYGTLDKKDCQDFMKRLRQHCLRDLGIEKIRFYLAGEYGDQTLRPHYHAIIFGLGLCDISDVQLFSRNDLGQPFFVSSWLQEIWTHGHVLLSDVNWKVCAYVGRYVTKKLNGSMDISYAVRNCIKEFALMSRKPGLGKEYLDLHPDCLDFQSINLTTPEGGLKISIPQYYLKQLELTDPKRYAIIKAERRKFVSDKNLLELSKTDLGFAEYLSMKEEKRKEKIKVLKRKV